MSTTEHGGQNIYEFKGDAEFFFARHKRLLAQKDYFGALSSLRRAGELEKGYKAKLALADFFANYRLYFYAERQYFMLLSRYTESAAEVYASLSQMYYATGDNYNGMSYFNRFLRENGGAAYMDDDEDYYSAYSDDYDDYDGDYRLVYPPTEEMYEELVDEAKAAIGAEKYDEARQMLLSVPESSAWYLPARNNLALSRLFAGDTAQALSIVNSLISRWPDDIFTLCTACSVYRFAGQTGKALEAAEKLRGVRTDDEFLLYKAAAAFCELEDHAQVYVFLRKLLDIKPLDLRALRLIAIACFNLQRYDESREWLLGILEIDGGDLMSKGYLGLLNQIAALSVTDGFKLAYMVTLPSAVKQPLEKRLKKLLAGEALSAKDCNPDEFLQLYSFIEEEYGGRHLPALLEKFAAMDGIMDGINRALLSTKIELKYKRQAVHWLARSGYRGNVHMTAFREYGIRHLRYPRGYFRMDGHKQAAYCRALSALAVYSEDVSRTLSRTAYNLFGVADVHGVDLSDTEAVAAVLCYEAHVRRFARPMQVLHEDFKFKSADFKRLRTELKLD